MINLKTAEQLAADYANTMSPQKCCTECGKTKDMEDFSMRSTNKSHEAQCKPCMARKRVALKAKRKPPLLAPRVYTDSWTKLGENDRPNWSKS